MNSAKLLDPLIFGGGSMLRLCHELNRYSVGLDFWFVKAIPQDDFFDKCGKALDFSSTLVGGLRPQTRMNKGSGLGNVQNVVPQ